MVAERLDELVGRPVDILVSEPWEFTTQYGAGPFRAFVERAEAGTLALKLERLLSFRGVSFDVVVVLARHEGESLADLLTGGRVDCNATPIAAGVDEAFGAASTGARGTWSRT